MRSSFKKLIAVQ